MSLEELWQLFPIILKEHNPLYKAWYETEKQQIINSIKADNIMRINHIGSSAVAGLISKPTVDILCEINKSCNISIMINALASIGYELMLRSKNPLKLEFCKGYTSEGFAEKVYHLHVRFFGDWDELYFRDYLIAHPDVAYNYVELKLKLCKAYKHNRNEYTNAKADFITKHSKAAKQEFKNRYKP